MDHISGTEQGRHAAPVPPAECVAHDLANLLTILAGSLEMATRHASGNAAISRHLTTMHMATERAGALVEQLRLSLKSVHGQD